MRAAIYVRVSTVAQEDDGTSLGTQEAACRQFVAECGGTVDEEYALRETHSGGELWERPALTRLRDGMRAHRFDAVVCYAVDRLSRSQIHLGLLLSEAEHARVAVHFVTEPLENTSVGIFLQQARIFAAELEREKIRERSMRGKRAVLQSGRLVGSGTHPYGYRHDKARGARTVEETEAAVVRQMFDWVATEGCSVREVTRRLRERGIPPPGTGKFAYSDMAQDRQWGTSQVLRMLRNPAYKGETYALRLTADHHKRGRPDFRPRDEWLRLPDHLTPAIVAPAVWDAAQRQLSTNTGDATRSVRIPALLRGHIFCPLCGRRMHPEMDHGRLRYRCGARTALERCPAPQLTAAEVEPWAWERVAAALLDPRLMAAGVAAAETRGMTEGVARDRDRARRELKKIERQQERLVEQFGASDNPDFPWHIVEAKITALQRDRARWQETLDTSERLVAASRREEGERRDLSAWCARVAANLPTLDFDTKRLALDVLGVRVEAMARDAATWRLSFNPR